MKLVAAMALLALTLPCGGAQAAQIDELKAGKIQCYSPNAATHHCQSMSRYVFTDGKISNPSQIMLSATPLAVLNMDTPAVFTDANTACGTVHKGDIDGATVTLDGAPAPPDIADRVKAQLWSFFSQYDGQQVCSEYVPDGDGYRTVNTRDGKIDTLQAVAHVIMVRAEDGWSVGP